ncbi:MAG: hypothetical protein D6733_03315 [Methanobacteriota archaeon]|nr:MAG: hypothetical protein D6733_03315 [Euryarchaeota archaeon]
MAADATLHLAVNLVHHYDGSMGLGAFIELSLSMSKRPLLIVDRHADATMIRKGRKSPEAAVPFS